MAKKKSGSNTRSRNKKAVAKRKKAPSKSRVRSKIKPKRSVKAKIRRKPRGTSRANKVKARGSVNSSVGKEFRLTLLGPHRTDSYFLISEGNNLVGRWDPEDGAFPEIDLEPVDVESKISRKHCVIERNGNEITIEDVGSLNGTFINQLQIRQGEIHRLRDGDEILVGRTLLKFEIARK